MTQSTVFKPSIVGRFAPSPTGRIHAGNIFAALITWLMVRSQNGRIVLRIDDLDRERSKASYIDGVQSDLEMLGLTWDEGPYFQQGRDETYRSAFEKLPDLYPCFCTRADLHAASAPHAGEKTLYPGTCRGLSKPAQLSLSQKRAPSWRIAVPDKSFYLEDLIQGPNAHDLLKDCGDFVVRRANGEFAYHLACIVDDAEQGVNLVVRGVDLLYSTPQQLFLQEVLGLPHPAYAHVPLLVAQDGRRLSKRDKDAALDELIVRFGSAEGIIGHIAYLAGLQPSDAPASPESLLRDFTLDPLLGVKQIFWR